MSLYVVDTGRAAPLEATGFRSLENPSTPLDPWNAGFGGTLVGNAPASSGVRVTADNAMTVSAFRRGVTLIANAVARLRAGVFRESGRGGRGIDFDRRHPAHRLLRLQPNEAMTPFTFKQVLTGHAVSRGNGYAYIDRRADGSPAELWPLDPSRTFPERIGGVLWYVHKLRSGEKRLLDPADVLHVKGLGFDGLEGYHLALQAKEVLGNAMACQLYGGKFFASGARPSGVLTHPREMKEVARNGLQNSFNRIYTGLDGSHRVIVLEEGVNFTPTSINARESQLLETRAFNLIEIANFLNLPPHKLGAAVNVSYKSLEQENQAFLDDSIDPWLVSWEEECEAKLLTEPQRRRQTHGVMFDRSRMVTPDSTTLYDSMTKATGAGLVSFDEGRAKLGLPPHPAGVGGTILRPGNTLVMGGTAAAPAASALLAVPDVRQQTASDCGAAAVEAVCRFFSVGPADRQGYLDGLGTTAAGTPPAAVTAFLGRLGLAVSAASEMSAADLAAAFSQGMPVLCPVQCGEPSGSGSGHWVVVVGTGLGQVFFHDPAAGLRLLPEADWLARWHDADADGTAYRRYGIAVGKSLPAPAAPAAPAEAADPADPEPTPDAGAARAVLLDAASRMMRRVGHDVRRAVRGGNAARLAKCLAGLEAAHARTVADALAAPLAALRPGGDPRALAASLLAWARDALSLVGPKPGGDLAEAVREWLDLAAARPDLIEPLAPYLGE